MREVIATAIRIEDTVQVTIHSFLRNNGWVASVTGTYPGDVVHIKDPGHAEVYLDEHETHGSLISLRSPMPWSTTVNIVDLKHNEIAIFANQHEVNRIPVTSMPVEFEVYAIVGSEHWGVVIMPFGHAMGNLFHRVFGPTSHEECVQWVTEHGKIDFF